MTNVVLFTIFSIPIYAYGLMAGLSIIVITFLAIKLLNNNNLLSYDNIIFILLCGGVTLVGGRFLALIEKNNYNLLSNEGMSFFGGLLFLVFFLFFFNVVFYNTHIIKNNILNNYLPSKNNFFKIINIIFLLLPLSISIWRIGCFMQGCCGGKDTFFIINILGKHPTQIYSIFANFIIFVILFRLYNKNVFLLPYYLIYYSLFRFCIEFIRFNKYYFLGLSIPQYFSILFFLIGVYSYILFKNKKV
jgi:phosphatidylglycerol---prolipoprotein diacylglyceryl transferase